MLLNNIKKKRKENFFREVLALKKSCEDREFPNKYIYTMLIHYYHYLT